MTNLKPIIKRVAAYMIDLFVVLIIASIVSSIPFLNKNMDAYQKTYKEYENKYKEYSEYMTLLQETYQDEEMTEEEYNKLIAKEKYQDILISKYEDNKITKGEYKEIIEEINKEFDKVASDYVYKLNKQGISNSIITLSCTLIYFGVIQYFLKGQTIGKKILKLKVISASDKKINIFNYLLRSLIVNDVLLNAIGIIFLAFASQKLYTSANNTIGMIISIVEAIIIFLVLTREDKRGLHDLLFNTKVISLEVPETEEKETVLETKKTSRKKVIDAEYKEEKEEPKKKVNKSKKKQDSKK